MSESEKKPVALTGRLRLRVSCFSDNPCPILAIHTSNPSDNGTLDLWGSMMKDVETIMTNLAQKYGIQSWAPETYAINYVGKYLKEYGFKPEIVEVSLLKNSF